MAPTGKTSISRYLQAMIPDWYTIDMSTDVGGDPRPGLVSRRAAATKLGVSSTHLLKLLNEGKGGDGKIAETVAVQRYRGDVMALRRAATAWCESHPEGAPAAAPTPPRDPLTEAFATFEWDDHDLSLDEYRRVKAAIAAEPFGPGDDVSFIQSRIRRQIAAERGRPPTVPPSQRGMLEELGKGDAPAAPARAAPPSPSAVKAPSKRPPRPRP